MTDHAPITEAEVREAYATTGTMRAAGAKLGISGSRVHQILRDGGGATRPLGAGERELLQTIIALSYPVLRGPSSTQLAEKLGIPDRTLRYRIARLRQRNLVFQDADHGYLPTDEARRKL